MENLADKFSIYIIPPLLTIVLGWTLAAISVIKGRFRTENILFSLICIWWTLMPVIFCSHHLFKGNFELIMKIERSFHFFYVYLPAILLLYLQKSFDLNKKYLVSASFVFSLIISVFVPTKYYISGLHTYKWGYSAKGEIVFQIFGTYAMALLIYSIWFFIAKMKNVRNFTERLKLKYILLSFIISAFLTLLNIPAINGIDFYAYGNFMFIPLLLLAYGVLRYRLMDIKSVLHITLIWGIISSFILIPNILIFIFIRPHLKEMNNIKLFLFLVIWFLLNYLYFRRIKPVIDRTFNKQKFNLIKSGNEFAENISYLKTLDKLIEVFTSTLMTTLNFKSVIFFIRTGEELTFGNSSGDTFEMDREIYDWFITDDHYVELDLLKTNPYYSPIIYKMTDLLTRFNSFYIIPLVRNNELLGITMSGERLNLRHMSRDEISFIESAKRSMAISISNSVMYQKLSDLKDNLEKKVATRTEELLKAKEGVEAANKDLLTANSALEEARRIADLDMKMAANVQKSILAEIPDNAKSWDVAAALMPMSMVSGDLYDFYIDDNDLKGLILLDVSGHGIASGLITMIAKSVFHRNFFMHKALGLGKVAEYANKELIGEIGNTDKYLTGIMLRFSENTVEYINAAHPDIILKKKLADHVKIIKPSSETYKGSIFGVAEMDNPYKSLKFQVESGDIIALFSDGITEAIGADKSRFETKGIARGMMQGSDDSSEKILKRIIEDLKVFKGNEKYTDDMILIVLKKK